MEICIINKQQKDLTGEFEDRNFTVTRGDSRVMLTVPKNELTEKFSRDNRFILDNPESDQKLVYTLTKPLKVGWVYEGEGIFNFILQEGVITKDDNVELSIADYYKYKSGITTIVPGKNPIIDTSNIDKKTGKEVWL